jgi:hypothetical protein
MSGAIPPLPNTASWSCVQLKEHRDNFTFTFIFLSRIPCSIAADTNVSEDFAASIFRAN